MSRALAKDNVLPLRETMHGRTISPADVVRYIERGDPHCELDVLVTPEIAQTLLRYNQPGVTNRHLSPRYVRAAVHAIENGLWINTGEPVIITRQRILNDGQHRLEAVVASGQPAIMDLRFGIERAAFEATNTGKRRSAADILGAMQISNAAISAATARLLIAYEEGLPGGLHRVANTTEIVKGLTRWPEVSEAATMASLLPNIVKSSAVCAVLVFALRTANEPAVHEFNNVLRTGAGDSDNPPHLLREWIFRRGPHWSRGERISTLANGIIAWNAYRKGVRLKKLDWRAGAAFPSVEGMKL